MALQKTDRTEKLLRKTISDMSVLFVRNNLGGLSREQDPRGNGHSARGQRVSGFCLHGLLLGSPARSKEFYLKIFLCPFHLERFYDYITFRQYNPFTSRNSAIYRV